MKKLTIVGAVCAALALGACGGDKKKDDAKVAKADAKKADEKKADEKQADEKKADEKQGDDAAAGAPPYTHVAFGRFKVKDYAGYKEAFDKGNDARVEAGVKQHWISQDPADANVVMVAVGVAGGLDKLKAHMESEEVKKAHEEHLDGEPEFMLLGEIKHGKPAPEGQKSAGDIFVAHEVADFDKWLEVFKAHEKARVDASAIEEGVVLAEDGKTVGVHVGYSDEAKMKAFMESDDLKKAMAESGVVGEPKIFFAKLVDEKSYDTAVAAK